MPRHFDIHPYAHLLPPADEAEMKALTADILANGLKVPIVLFQGKILDGRSRYLACHQLKKPISSTQDFYGTDQEALARVRSYNLYRRHLTPSQKATVAQQMAKEMSRLNDSDLETEIAKAARETGAAVSSVRAVDRIERAQTNREKKAEAIESLMNGQKTIQDFRTKHVKQIECPNCHHTFIAGRRS